MDNQLAKRVPGPGHIINLSIEIGQAEGGNISEVTPGMVDWTLKEADDDFDDLSDDDRETVRDLTAGALEMALKRNGYWAD